MAIRKPQNQMSCFLTNTNVPMAPHSSPLAWKIPWAEEPRRLQSMGSLRVGHDWATSLSLFTFVHWRRHWQPTPVFLPGESQDGGAWWAAVFGVTQSRTQLKWLSSSSNVPIQTITIHVHNLLGGSWKSLTHTICVVYYQDIWHLGTTVSKPKS